MPEMMPDIPNGYVVFELAWRGCWHHRRDGETTMSRCYNDERAARLGAHQDFNRWAWHLKMSDMLTCRR
jgi:hypothetical protein